MNTLDTRDLIEERTEIQDTEKTNVKFYLATYEANESDEQPYKEVIAVFVDDKWLDEEFNTHSFDCYAHLGQHSTCSESFLAEKCKKALETEYQDLKTELESIGYNLNII